MINQCSAKKITAFLLGELTAAQQTQLKKHLDNCRECRSTYEEYRAVISLYPQVTDTPSAELISRTVSNSIHAATRSPKPASDRFFVWPRWSMASAILLILLLIMASPRLWQPIEQDELLANSLLTLEYELAELIEQSQDFTSLLEDQDPTVTLDEISSELNDLVRELDNL